MNENDQNNYQILNTIATGGTAVLYKAIQNSLDRPVVVKRLHSHLTSDPNFTRRFELEAKAAASFDHENIVRIIDFGSTNENYYIVMEYIDGLSLKEIFEKQGALSDELALLIAHEICMGLDHAHQRGIIHRDIKPANIMITSEGQVKITDFGLAKLHQSQTQQTVANTLLGTPLYMSPEQAIGDNIDGRSDLFSLGTICYEMVTGTQPFLGNNYAAVIQNILHGTISPPSRIGKNIHPEVEMIIMKALNREPGKRFRTALEMARAIESHLGQEKILKIRERLRRLMSGGVDACIARGDSKVTKRAKRKNLIFAGIAVLVVSASVVMLVSMPKKTDVLKSRIKALASPDPQSAPKGEFTASLNEITGSPLIIGLPEMEVQLPAGDGTDTAVVKDDAELKEGTEQVAGGTDEIEAPDGANDGNEPDKGNEVEVEAPVTDTKPTDPESRTSVESERVIAVGYLDINVEPDAEIYVDGAHRTSGNRLGPVEMAAGQHQIACKKEGYKDYRETVNVQKGELSRRRITLRTITGGLNFDTIKGAQIYIDGTFKGTTPIYHSIVLPVGNHKVELRKVGYKNWASEVYIPADEILQLKIDLIPD